MATLTLAISAAAISFKACQDAEMVENPEYKRWSSQKVGAWVKYKTETDAMKMEYTTVWKLKELTPEKAVIDLVTEMEMAGEMRTIPATFTIPAKVKKNTDSEGKKVEKTGEGDEDFEIKGTKYSCHCVEMNVGIITSTSIQKTWLSDKIVGGVAKRVTRLGFPRMTTTLTALEWKAGE